MALLLSCASSVAQVAGGTVSGIVAGPQSVPVASAAVTITNLATGVARKTFTNAHGLYSMANLNTGQYTAAAAADGFSVTTANNVTVSVGSQLQVNFSMTPGSGSDKVVSTQRQPAVELFSSTMGVVVAQTTVHQLPLNGRDWTSLAALRAGVAPARTQPVQAISNQRANRGLGEQLSISGGRPQWNNYRVDGISIEDYSNGGPGSVLGNNFGVDAIQEFNVVTSNPGADYGRTAAGILNAAIRSGSETYHASVYEFLRNSALDARNYFDSTTKIPPFKQNQYGATGGGPIFRNKTFFFVNYEALKQNVGLPQVDIVPSANARNGQLVSGPVVVDPQVKPYLAFYPLPDGPTAGDTGSFTFNLQQQTTEQFVTARVDHKISSLDTVSMTYFFDTSQKTGPDPLDVKNISAIARRQMVAINENHFFTPSLLNSLRAGISRVISISPTTVGAINPLASDPSLGFAPTLAVGLINVGGLTAFPGGLGAVGEYDFHFNSLQVYNDALWTKGKHQVKFGGNFEHILDNQLGKANPNGQFLFSSLSTFLTNKPQSFNAPLAGAITPRDLRSTIGAGYIQDDFRVRTNLSLNLGIRYEMSSVPSETAGRLSALRNLTDTTPALGSPYFNNPTKRNFEPRVGFSWDPFKTSKTVLRGAFGMYDVLPLPYQFEVNSLLSAPFFNQGNITTLGVGSFPKAAFPQLTANKLRYGYIQQTPSRNYVMQWNVNVQRDLASGTSITVAYVGAHGVHNLFRDDDTNIVLPALTPAGYMWPAKTGTRINPNVGQITALWWTGSSLYNAWQTQVLKRYQHGLLFGAGFTLGKSIDDGSSSVAGDQFGNSVSSLPFFDPTLRRALSDFNINKVLSLNVVYAIPGPKTESLLTWGARGWTVGGIYQASSGLPFTPVMSGDPLGLSSADTFAFPDRIRTAGCETGVNSGNQKHYINTSCFAFPSSPRLLGNSRRNSLIGPGLSDLDASLSKDSHLPKLSERFAAQFRIEAFNLFNRSNFNSPLGNRSLFSAAGAPITTAGLITTTATTSRQIQAGLKLSF